MNGQFLEREVRHPLHEAVFKRARDFYLYTHDGTRFIDLDMAEGRAVLGYKASGIGARIKQNLDKGILHDIPSMWQSRFAKSLSLVFPHYTYAGLYTRMEAEDASLTQSNARGSMWRAFAGSWSDECLRSKKTLCVPLPLAWDPPLYALLAPLGQEQPTGFTPALWVEDELSCMKTLLMLTSVSPVLCAALCLSLGTLLTSAQDTAQLDDMPSYASRPFPQEHKNKTNIYAITNAQSELKGIRARATQLELPRGWEQRGAYVMLPPQSEEDYSRMLEVLWSNGFFVPARPRRLMTLPPFFTKRELRSWNTAVAAFA